MKFNFDTDFFEGLFDTDGHPITDVEEDYEIPGVGSMKLKFLDVKYLVDGVEFFRPFIRGFLVLLLGFFHIQSLLSLIGQDGGVAKEGKKMALKNKGD